MRSCWIAVLAFAFLFSAIDARAENYRNGTVSMAADGTLTFHLNIWRRPEARQDIVIVTPRNSGYAAMLALAKGVTPEHTEALPPWPGYDGIISENNGLITYYWRVTAGDGTDAIFSNRFPPENLLAAGMIKAVGGMSPGDIKPVPAAPPSIGIATMLPDGTIRMSLMPAKTPDGAIFEGTTQMVAPTDPAYEDTRRHIGINPGETKPIPPWPDPK